MRSDIFLKKSYCWHHCWGWIGVFSRNPDSWKAKAVETVQGGGDDGHRPDLQDTLREMSGFGGLCSEEEEGGTEY